MTIDNFSILFGYTLWLLILLGIGCRAFADHSRAFRVFQHGEWIRLVFEPTGSVRTPFPERVMQRCGRSDRLLEQMAAAYARNAEAYGPQERLQLSQALARILLDRIRKLRPSDAVSRCLILRCLWLTGIRSPRIELFIEACAKGSQMEQTWVHTLRSADDTSEKFRWNHEGRSAACN